VTQFIEHETLFQWASGSGGTLEQGLNCCQIMPDSALGADVIISERKENQQ